MKKKTIKIVFDNEEAADHFISWLCNHGEQDYWDWMEYRERKKDGDITAISFDYHGRTNKDSEFGKHPIIARCGRLDNDGDA